MAANKAKSIINIAKGAGRKLKNMNIIQAVEKGSEDAVYQYLLPFKVNQKIAIGGIVGVTAVKGGLETASIANRTKMGRIEPGEGLSHMTSSVRMSPLLEQAQQGNYQIPKHAVSGPIFNNGAEGDIVFALHNMR